MRLFVPASSTTQASVLPRLACGDILGLPIRWMHLDREHVARIEELQQQREPAEAPGQFSQQLLRPLMKQLPDAPSLERSIGDAAGMVIAVAQQPGFADGAIAGQRSGEQVGQDAGRPRADTGRSVRSAVDTGRLDSCSLWPTRCHKW